MKDFLSYARLLTLTLPLVFATSLAKNSHAGDNSMVGTALVGVGTMGAMITIAAGDSAASVADCAKCATGTCNANVPHWNCVALPLSVAAIIAGIVMMGSSGDTADAVQGTENEFETPPPGGMDPGNWDDVVAKLCNADTANTYLCDPNGKEKMKKDLAMVDDLNRQGLLGVDDPAKLTGEVEKAKRMLGNMESGNYAAVMADGGGAPVDEDSAGRGRAGLAGGGGFDTGADDHSEFGDGANANYKGMAGLTAAGGSGGNGKVGPANAKLGKVEWNGGLDMVDSETGKSLTIWERATRRYMGTPEGKRGFTMARIEFLRKQSTQKVAKAPKAPAGEKVAKKESSPIQPVQMSTSQIIGR